MTQYKIDKQSDTPLYVQIKQTITDAISKGELKPGDKLPSVSCLAKDIGVTQATVRRALQDLNLAGHTSCHVGRGTFIQDAKQIQNRAQHNQFGNGNNSPGGVQQRTSCNPREFAAHRLRMGVSKALCDILSLADKPGIINFTRGVPDPALLPESFLEDLTQDTFSGDTTSLVEMTEPQGLYELRKTIADRFSDNNTHVTPDQVLITNGSLQAITLVAQSFKESGQPVICETPCFKGVTDTFGAMGHWVETVNRDYNGPIPEQLNRLSTRDPALLYLCPYAHNPIGTNLSADRYNFLVEWATRTGSTILADEIFKENCFTRPLQPSILKALGADQTIIISSLSKTVMTGLRLGWIISSTERIQQLTQLKKLNDHSSPTLIQSIALTLLKSDRFDKHTKKMQTIYKSRMDTLLAALKKHMPNDIRWSTPGGSFSIMLELPPGHSSIALFLKAIDKGVSFLPGPLFDIDHRFVHCFRLSTAWLDENQIQEGIELLNGAIQELLQTPAGDSGLSGLGSYV